MRSSIALVALWTLLGLTWALGVQPVLADDPLDRETREIAKQLLCPVCENVSVADSPVELSQQIRALIRKKLEQGESREEIIQYFVDRYGEAILLEPPKRGFALGAWLVPPVAMALGGLLVLLLVRTRQRAFLEPEEGPPDVPEEELQRYEELLLQEPNSR